MRPRLISERAYETRSRPAPGRCEQANELAIGAQGQEVPAAEEFGNGCDSEAVHRVNRRRIGDEGRHRISLEIKATVKVGPFSRGGYSRQGATPVIDDFQTQTTLTPFGVLLPETGKSHVWSSQSKVTADSWWTGLRRSCRSGNRTVDLHTLAINADNGRESNGRRTRWLKRLVALSDADQLNIQLAYYPPYHSKYNPVERVWGVLENHWRGEIIDSVEKVLGLARSMTYRHLKPSVRKVCKVYRKGVSVAKQAMQDIEARLERTEGLEDWFMKIVPRPQTG